MIAREAALVAERDALAAEVGALRGALRIFTGAAYPVSVEINDRGHAWSEAYLDQALQEANEILSRTSAARAEAGHG